MTPFRARQPSCLRARLWRRTRRSVPRTPRPRRLRRARASDRTRCPLPQPFLACSEQPRSRGNPRRMPMLTTQRNRPIEWSLTAATDRANPFMGIEVDAIITSPSGDELRVPAFYAGDGVWRVRFASPELGQHTYRMECSDPSDSGLHGVEGSLVVEEYEGANPLYGHGPLKVSENRRYLEHADGTPFFWLGDTWWMGFAKRLSWPGGFRTLAEDRLRKGYNVIQIVAGLYPDMAPFDPRQENEAGTAWMPGFERINPAYWDAADVRLDYLVERGLMPAIVGCWGYYLDAAGEEAMKKHWRYIIARWGAYPVTFCLCGEATMAFYLSEEWNTPEYAERMRKGWTAIGEYVRSIDPYGRLKCIHPGGNQAGRDMADPQVMDFEWLQGGHGDRMSFAPTLALVRRSVEREPRMPVINSETAYEGIINGCWENVQRLFFWSNVLTGTCGHTYGANGIWQINCKEHPYGPSPHGRSWGDTPWDEAMNLKGSEQLGLGKRLLERYEWWKFEPRPDWCEPHSSAEAPEAPMAAGIDGVVRVIYIPQYSGPPKVTKLGSGKMYRAYYFNPMDGTTIDLQGVDSGPNGEWTPPTPPVMGDWVLVMEAV
ncbi:MAG: DUF4038 domain-containing protein [Armatimonadia bacterium]|nr:DUF4038 domain-containing protein [Armatimonadia bacterium]